MGRQCQAGTQVKEDCLRCVNSGNNLGQVQRYSKGLGSLEKSEPRDIVTKDNYRSRG